MSLVAAIKEPIQARSAFLVASTVLIEDSQFSDAFRLRAHQERPNGKEGKQTRRKWQKKNVTYYILLDRPTHIRTSEYIPNGNLYRSKLLLSKRFCGSQKDTLLRFCVPFFVVALLVSNEKEKRIMLDRCYAS